MLDWHLNILVGLAGLLGLGCRVLRGRRVFVRIVRAEFRPVIFVDLPGSPESWQRFWGVLLGFPVLRLRGAYLAIVTLAFGGDHPACYYQLAKPHRGAKRHIKHPAPQDFQALPFSPLGVFRLCSASNFATPTAWSFSTTSSSRWRCLPMRSP